MNEPTLTVAVFLSDGHAPIYVSGTRQELQHLSLRIRMSWELYGPIPTSTTTLAAHSLALGGMMVNPKHITRLAFVNDKEEVVPPPVGFVLGG